MVGIAFSIGFTVGPPIGAYFASFNLFKIFPILSSLPMNAYSCPALFAFILIIIETIFLFLYLPETLIKKRVSAKPKSPVASTPPSKQVVKGISTLYLLSAFHFAFLFFFSGMEFTLTFLTFDQFDFTHVQQGKLLGFIGICSAFLQGILKTFLLL